MVGVLFEFFFNEREMIISVKTGGCVACCSVGCSPSKKALSKFR